MSIVWINLSMNKELWMSFLCGTSSMGLTLFKIVLLLQSIGSISSFCRNGWIRYENSCYMFTNEIESWGEAVAECRAFRSELAEIETDQEFDFIRGQMLKMPATHDIYWIGASDIEVESQWRWLNSDKQLNTTHWFTGEPNGDLSENCLELYRGPPVSYYDHFCSEKRRFICEMRVEDGLGVLG